MNNSLLQYALLVASLYFSLRFLWYLNAKIYRSVMSNWTGHVFLLPGVAFHEFSHYIMCRLTGCRVVDMSLYRFDHKSGELGYVTFTTSRRFRMISNCLIGLAPLIGGLCFLTISLYSLGLPIEDLVVGTSLLEFSSNLQEFATSIDIGPYTLVLVFLMLSVSHGSLPSVVDLKLASPFLTIIVITPVLLHVLGIDVLRLGNSICIAILTMLWITVSPSVLLIGTVTAVNSLMNNR